VRRLILTIVAVAALALAGALPVVAEHEGRLAGSCPAGSEDTDVTTTPGGGGPPDTAVLDREVDRNGDGHACVILGGAAPSRPLLPKALVDNNVHPPRDFAIPD
jgi:hypothetical protein